MRSLLSCLRYCWDCPRLSSWPLHHRKSKKCRPRHLNYPIAEITSKWSPFSNGHLSFVSQRAIRFTQMESCGIISFNANVSLTHSVLGVKSDILLCCYYRFFTPESATRKKWGTCCSLHVPYFFRSKTCCVIQDWKKKGTRNKYMSPFFSFCRSLALVVNNPKWQTKQNVNFSQ